MSEFSFQAPKTYFAEVSGNPDSRHLIYVLHGYGQLAKYFIRKFEKAASQALIVAPEGMHRYYLNGNSGRVGASWMTSHQRESDIQDNIRWLDELHRQIMEKYEIDEITILGFSQGGATAARWVQLGRLPKVNFILWASVFPPDLPFQSAFLDKIDQFDFVLGRKDEFFDEPDTRSKIINAMQNAGARIIEYDGAHDIDPELVAQIVKKSYKKEHNT